MSFVCICNFGGTIVQKTSIYIEVYLPLILLILLSHAVAFMRFSQSAYSQAENNSPLSVSLMLDIFGGSGSGLATITQDIVGQIIAFAQAGNTATGKEIMRELAIIEEFSDGHVLCVMFAKIWKLSYMQIQILSQQI